MGAKHCICGEYPGGTKYCPNCGGAAPGDAIDELRTHLRTTVKNAESSLAHYIDRESKHPEDNHHLSSREQRLMTHYENKEIAREHIKIVRRKDVARAKRKRDKWSRWLNAIEELMGRAGESAVEGDSE